jgi:hypothetical protein
VLARHRNRPAVLRSHCSFYFRRQKLRASFHVRHYTTSSSLPIPVHLALIGIRATPGGLPPLLEIIDHLPSGYQGAIFVAMHRQPDAPNMLLKAEEH